MSNYLYFWCLSLLLWIIDTFNRNIKCTVLEMALIESFFIYFEKSDKMPFSSLLTFIHHISVWHVNFFVEKSVCTTC